MKIVIGTKNLAKVSGAKSVLSKIYEGAEFVTVDASSGVNSQPLSDEETIKGAINRAINAMSIISDSDIGVGLEGGVESIKGNMFQVNWSAIIDRNGNAGIGSGARMMLPSIISQRLENGEELGTVMKSLIGKDTRNDIGSIGVLTKGLYTRVDLFSDSTKCALASFLSKEHYGDLPKKIVSSYL